ncbi:hypothetical protein [Fodinibius halophilus]|uniref:DUF4142 domain-containing protein n=1 Tax=Fodinibius halophilus TaxID=1736908 RepID=A0A6M1T6Q4_9BACT|nr:hypothetical protein [Fodinibius halophilus]NGP89837.1 hypothetical protein [Fodinibius halophilus]
MHRFLVLVVVVISCLFLSSCSGTSEVAQQETSSQEEVKDSPPWYSTKSVVDSEDKLLGYASALNSDSASSVSRAVSRAKVELQAALSDKLEEIRSDAVSEYGSGYGLDSAKFLIALRKADKAINDIVTVTNTEARNVEGYESYRGFAQVKVSKSALVERIGKRLAGYDKAWNAMKESKAFESF